ncbi:hypothetical protein BJV82DRAFT_694220 [Fennellomyces sp. T-0311]|nr:hypothetical protein BJV82DRAFT_694220 [Fennellomyces sp. T-0311]
MEIGGLECQILVQLWKLCVTNSNALTAEAGSAIWTHTPTETKKSAIPFRNQYDYKSYSRQQGSLLSAINVYKQGLRNVPSSDDQHAQLQKEMSSVSAALAVRQKIQQLVPYDIWYLIFQYYLRPRDLLRCAGVSRLWYNFVVNIPGFWQQFPMQVSQMTRSMLHIVTPYQPQVIQFHEYMDRDLIDDIRMLLAYWNCNSTLKLLFYKVPVLSSRNINLLTRLLRSLNCSVQVEFIDCAFPRSKVIFPILESCTNLSYVSFSQSSVETTGFSESPLNKIEIPDIQLFSLTYLKLSFQDAAYVDDGQTGRNLLCGIFCKCPNLIHLFLDSGCLLHHRECITESLKHCSRLENLVMNYRGEMPISVISSINDREFNPRSNFVLLDSIPNYATRLRRLVLNGGHIELDQDDIGTAFMNNYQFLEYLHLNYGHTVGPDALSRLADYGAPRLREICITANRYHPDLSNINNPSIHKILSTLFSRCPNLEVVAFEDTVGAGFHKSINGVIEGDSEVVKAIAEHCPRLRHLKILGGRRRQTLDSILHFAAIRGSRLTYLETDMVRDNILEVVKKLPSLQYLHVRLQMSCSMATFVQVRNKEAATRLVIKFA